MDVKQIMNITEASYITSYVIIYEGNNYTRQAHIGITNVDDIYTMWFLTNNGTFIIIDDKETLENLEIEFNNTIT